MPRLPGAIISEPFLVVILALMVCGATMPADAAEPAFAADRDAPDSPAGVELFRTRIEPALVKHCYECHAGPGAKGGLRLDTRRGIRHGGSSGAAVLPRDAAGSLLIHAIRYEGLEMPPAGKLPAQVIADFERWVQIGAPDSRSESLGAARHWSFLPRLQVRAPQLTDGDARSWIFNPVDAFIWQRLAATGLRPAPLADRRTLIRRVTFDLTGLPPTPEEVASFLEDSAPAAYERLVDRLLASPQYGERWGQHWLDVVRYAETEGFEYDQHRAGAWQYRDYVIGSMNDDKPFDRFLLEQLAGDECDADDRDCLAAAGFHRLGPVRRNAGNQNVAFSRNEVLTERTDAIGFTFLGLTLGCARCHDHRFDDIPQQDYYRLQAFLAASHDHDLLIADERTQTEWQYRTREISDRLQLLQKRRAGQALSSQPDIDQKIAELRASLPGPLPTISTVRNDFGQQTVIHVLRRGDGAFPGVRVGPRVLSAFLDAAVPELAPDVEQPRTRLAQWLNSPDHPLTARVYVNRVWQYHFGRGIVSTPNDFGANGATPSHPELLDWLANELIAAGRHTKPLHRLIVLSSTYRQSSVSPAPGMGRRVDPENRLLWHFPPRRLSAEEVRDALLAISGTLNLRAGGPSVMTPVADDLVRLLYKPDQWVVSPDIGEHHRRSIYLTAKRNLPLPFMQVLDRPDMQISCPQRESSTHALQALELLNGELTNRLAEKLGQRLEIECGSNRERLIELAFLLVVNRPAAPAEAALAREFLANSASLKEFALMLFNLNAFIYVN